MIIKCWCLVYVVYFADELINGLLAYGCPLQLGSANGFMANGDVTNVPIPIKNQREEKNKNKNNNDTNGFDVNDKYYSIVRRNSIKW